MELRQDIRFTTTSDGLTLAYATSGRGPKLVRAGTWMSHLECEARERETSAMLQALGQHCTLVRYDPRGCGLSMRQVPPPTFEQLVGDLGTVVDTVAPDEPVALFGVSCGAPLAIAYAARHPERVSALVILNGYGRAYLSAASTPPHLLEEAKLLLASARQGWSHEKSAFRQIFTSQMLGAQAADPQMRKLIEDRMRLSMSPEMAEHFLRLNYSMDVKAECALLQCPAIVFHARDDQMVAFDQGRKLAAWIPGARFVALDYDAHIMPPHAGAGQQFLAQTFAFLGQAEGREKPRLSKRQAEILQLVADGLTDKQVARELGLSPRTVEMHMALAMRALASSNRVEAVRRATAEGLLAA